MSNRRLLSRSSSKALVQSILTILALGALNCRFLKIGHARMLIRKVAVAAAVGVLAILLFGSGGVWLQRTLASGAYAAAVAMMVLLWPGAAGISREQLVRRVRLLGWS